jgi:hypothetical protein
MSKWSQAAKYGFTAALPVTLYYLYSQTDIFRRVDWYARTKIMSGDDCGCKEGTDLTTYLQNIKALQREDPVEKQQEEAKEYFTSLSTSTSTPDP